MCSRWRLGEMHMFLWHLTDHLRKPKKPKKTHIQRVFARLPQSSFVFVLLVVSRFRFFLRWSVSDATGTCAFRLGAVPAVSTAHPTPLVCLFLVSHLGDLFNTHTHTHTSWIVRLLHRQQEDTVGQSKPLAPYEFYLKPLSNSLNF